MDKEYIYNLNYIRMQTQVNFIVENSFLENNLPTNIEDDWSALSSLSQATIYLTYLYLNKKLENITLSSDLVPNAINIAHPNSLLKYRPSEIAECYLICWQQDYPRCLLANEHIVMNQSQTRISALKFKDLIACPGKRTVLHYPPDPALVPRDSERGDLFERIGYFGDPKNLLPEIQSETWKTRLQDHGMQLVVKDARSESSLYTDLDAIVAIRPPIYSSKQKSAHKLWNAWRAGTPAILGNEPGFLDFKNSDLDYIEAKTADELLQILIMLKKNPEIVKNMRSNGKLRAQEISADAIINKWINYINDYAIPSAMRWFDYPLSLRINFLHYRHFVDYSFKFLSNLIYK